MSVLTRIAPPFHNIPISDGEETDHPDLNEPVVLDLQENVDELAGGAGDDSEGDGDGDGDSDGDGSEGLERSETDDEISYDISSDVLFATDSANLNDDAEQSLEQVAEDIDDAGIETVHIDGHTDNTGNDAVNEPLSQDRAEAVEELLAELVDSGDVEWEVEGHGSADPVAENDSEDGREQNRRVTITLDK
ncbi:OmpA family protein [Nocardiopsis sp. HNM0947]|uniref:OmpA family protein n=2 Tax=Nocardiopsis coralli TaxID=2772213 RepID=A0ABR9PA44_9ACTN|nr:OmpA family protein [Nocardiopsis coralli]